MAAGSLRHAISRLANRLYVDTGRPHATTLIAGMGRSGTTWVEAVVNHDFSHRVLFEPFFAHHIPAAAVFPPCAYVRPSDKDPDRLRVAEEILSGQTPRGTVDRDHRGWVFRRRIIKDVRCNLMLGYFKAIRPTMPLVFVVRNPFSVAASWIQLGWGKIVNQDRLEIEAILEQEELLTDFPLIRRLMSGLDRSDSFERTVFQWCVLHFVPLQQLRAGDAYLVRYEDMIVDPYPVIDRLATYLGIPLAGPSIAKALSRFTSTDFLGRGSQVNRSDLIGDWKSRLSAQQVDRGREILAGFGLDGLYDENGMPQPDLALTEKPVTTAARSSRWPAPVE
jgi:hypothetical protein